LINHVLTTGNHLSVTLDHKTGDDIPASEKQAPYSWLGIPLKSEDKILGAFGFIEKQKNAFSKIQIELLNLASEHVAFIFERVTLDNNVSRIKAAGHAKNEFLAAMSHEIRTPINAIIGLTELLTGTELSDKQSGYLTMIDKSSQSLITIINDILDISKIEAGKLEFNQVDFDLALLLDDIKIMFADKIRQRNLKFRSIMDNRIPRYLSGDPFRLKQVLVNLLGNAEKFTENGEISIKISLIEHIESDVTLNFSVRDTGIGIHDEYIPTLFESYSQAGLSITEKYGGSGLGLSICKHLVKMMKGDIKIKSIPGSGSTFSFSAVFKEGSKKDNGETLPSELNISEKSESRGKYQDIINSCILVVDDHEDNCLVAREILKKSGFKTESAFNGIQAFQMIKTGVFDAVLMDLQMPGMDGYSVTKKIRDLPDLSNLPIIAMTAHAMTGTREKCIEAGMNDYISKPINTDDLLMVLSKWLRIYVITGKKPEGTWFHVPGIDVTDTLNRLDGNTDLMVRLLENFCIRFKGYEDKLMKEFMQGEYRSVSESAHFLKGVSSNFTSGKLFMAARKLEQLAESDDRDKIPDVIEDIKINLEEVIQSAEKVIKRLGNSIQETQGH